MAQCICLRSIVLAAANHGVPAATLHTAHHAYLVYSQCGAYTSNSLYKFNCAHAFGTGKGTQCDKIISRYEGVQHFSAGDLLRDAVKNGYMELAAILMVL